MTTITQIRRVFALYPKWAKSLAFTGSANLRKYLSRLESVSHPVNRAKQLDGFE
jgi:hypothetical protein